MKRLIFVICALSLLLAPNASVTAAPAANMIDARAFIGMTEGDLIAGFGDPARVEPSEYGFSWYVYNKDYKSFFMAGVQDGVVVAFYTNAKTLTYGGQFKFNSTKAAVKAKMGSPVLYYRRGNTIAIINNAKQKDIFAAGDKYVFVFYDNIAGGKVTSVLIVPQEAEEIAFMDHPELSPELEQAYARISVDLINAVRVRSGLKKLATDALDTKLAVSRSRDMRDRNYFSHYTPAPKSLSPFQQAKKIGIKYKSMGENIAFGDHNAILAHESFMNSAGHRSNILKKSYTKVGAGVAWGGTRYVLLTNEFTN